MTFRLPTINEVKYNPIVSDKDWMAKQSPTNYYARGHDALCNVINACYYGSVRPKKILDLGCGHGCVARMLKGYFTDATVVGQDVNQAWLDWCAANLEIETILSPANISDIDLPENTYDVIWLGSVFTHIPEAAAEHLLKEIRRALTPNGITVFSTAGRVIRNGFSSETRVYLESKKVVEMNERFDNGEYAFCSYEDSKYPDWGNSLTPISWMFKEYTKQNMFLISFVEGGFGKTQDIWAFRKTPSRYSWAPKVKTKASKKRDS